MRVAFSFIKKAMDDFSAKYPSPSSWKQITVVKASQDLPSLKLQLNKYQDPHEADNLLKVQKELDETKVILVSSVFLLSFFLVIKKKKKKKKPFLCGVYIKKTLFVLGRGRISKFPIMDWER
ncbi:palmitoyltransferase [Coelomomyces lativittatus]|nr:palmitoyltransferase [Coelomomyces lativittatus]